MDWLNAKERRQIKVLALENEDLQDEINRLKYSLALKQQQLDDLLGLVEDEDEKVLMSCDILQIRESESG